MKKLLLLAFVYCLVTMNLTIWSSGQGTLEEMAKILERPATASGTVIAERSSENSKARSARHLITYSFSVDSKVYSREVDDPGQTSKGQQISITYFASDPRVSTPAIPMEKMGEVQRGRQILIGFDCFFGIMLLLAARLLTRDGSVRV